MGASTRGAKEIKEHVYFTNFDWDGLAGRSMAAPWVPNQAKLKSHWEMHEGGDGTVGEGEYVAGAKMESGMEWAAALELAQRRSPGENSGPPKPLNKTKPLGHILHKASTVSLAHLGRVTLPEKASPTDKLGFE